MMMSTSITSGDDGDDATDDDDGDDGDIIENHDKVVAMTKRMMEDDEQHS